MPHEDGIWGARTRRDNGQSAVLANFKAKGQNAMTHIDAGLAGAQMTLSPEEHRRLRKRYRRRTTLTAYAFLGPNLAAFVVFLLIPGGVALRVHVQDRWRAWPG